LLTQLQRLEASGGTTRKAAALGEPEVGRAAPTEKEFCANIARLLAATVMARASVLEDDQLRAADDDGICRLLSLDTVSLTGVR
jgi:hypothetical protein